METLTMSNAMGSVASEYTIWNLVYLFSVAGQLAAAVLLLGNMNVSRDGIIKAYCAQNRVISFEMNGKLADYSQLKDVIKTSWINYIAFIYLFSGYLLGVLGEAPKNKWLSLIGISILTGLLFYIPHCIANRKAETFGEFCDTDLEKVGAVAYNYLDPPEKTKETIGEDAENIYVVRIKKV